MVVCFENTVGLLQAITYFVSVILSFFIVVPLGITLRHFQGSCILYAQVVWDGKTIFPYSEPSCDYILYCNLGLLLYGFWMGCYALWVHVPRRFPFARHHIEKFQEVEEHEEKFRIQGINPAFMLINAIMMFLVMSNAIVLTAGLQMFCNWAMESLEKHGKDPNVKLDTCSDLESGLDWSTYKIIRGDTIGVKGDSFYTTLCIAIVASWLMFFDWLFQFALNFSQSFTMCSCEIAEEKRKPDKAMLIAARRSRLTTPSYTPGGRLPPMLGDQGPMRPYAFRPPPGPGLRPGLNPGSQQMLHGPPQQYMQRQPQPFIQRPPPRMQEPMQMQQGYVPPRR